MSSASTKMLIDGHWVDCPHTDDYGVLGVRHVCDFGQGEGKPVKRLLLRRRALPPSDGTLADAAAQLMACKAHEGNGVSLRPAVNKVYQEAVDRERRRRSLVRSCNKT